MKRFLIELVLAAVFSAIIVIAIHYLFVWVGLSQPEPFVQTLVSGLGIGATCILSKVYINT